MTRDEISIIIICEMQIHFLVDDIFEFESRYLWDDLGADDLDFIEIFMILEERLDHSGFDNSELERYRGFTLQNLIDHVNLIMNPILV